MAAVVTTEKATLKSRLFCCGAALLYSLKPDPYTLLLWNQ